MWLNVLVACAFWAQVSTLLFLTGRRTKSGLERQLPTAMLNAITADNVL